MVSTTDTTNRGVPGPEVPDDDAGRLALADFLEGQDGPRAEFIRLQIDLENQPKGQIPKTRLKYQSDLLHAHGLRWAGDLAGQVLDYHFHRGFLRRVICHASALVEHGDSWMAQHPIRDLAIHEDPDTHEEAPHPTKLLMHPILAELECLDLGTAMWTEGDWAKVSGRDLPKLRQLVIRDLGPEAARWISGAPWWPHLAQLRLERQTNPWGLRELCQAMMQLPEIPMSGGPPGGGLGPRVTVGIVGLEKVAERIRQSPLARRFVFRVG